MKGLAVIGFLAVALLVVAVVFGGGPERRRMNQLENERVYWNDRLDRTGGMLPPGEYGEWIRFEKRYKDATGKDP